MIEGLNHPADQLAQVRQRIKELQAEETALKAQLIGMEPGDRVGRYFETIVSERSSRTVDSKKLQEAVIAEKGEAWLEQFMKETASTVVSIKEMV